MGSSFSVLEMNEKSEMATILKVQYEYCQSLNLSDAETNNHMMNEYNNRLKKSHPEFKIATPVLAQESKPSRRKSVVTSEKVADPTPTKKSAPIAVHGLKKPPQKPQRKQAMYDSPQALAGTSQDRGSHLGQKGSHGRRRSFDHNLTISESMDAAISAAGLNLAELKEEEEQKDAWDSVSSMPFCEVCHQTLKDEKELVRHCRFSEVHKLNLKKLGKEDEHADVHPDHVIDALTDKHVEGVHYKLLYHGSKLFWQSNKSIELHFYHHLAEGVIESVANNVSTGEELSRIYLQYALFKGLVERDVDADIEAHKKQVMNADRFAKEVDYSALQADKLCKAITSALLVRLKEDQVPLAQPQPAPAAAEVEEPVPVQAPTKSEPEMPVVKQVERIVAAVRHAPSKPNVAPSKPNVHGRDEAWDKHVREQHAKELEAKKALQQGAGADAPAHNPARAGYVDYLHPERSTPGGAPIDQRLAEKRGEYQYSDFKTDVHHAEQKVKEDEAEAAYLEGLRHADDPQQHVYHDADPEHSNDVLGKGVVFTPWGSDPPGMLLHGPPACTPPFQPVKLKHRLFKMKEVAKKVSVLHDSSQAIEHLLETAEAALLQNEAHHALALKTG